MIEPRSHVPLIHVPKPKKPKSRLVRGGNIKPVSAKRARINKVYSALRKKFLAEHPYCQWWLAENGYQEPGELHQYASRFDGRDMINVSRIPRSEDIHHKRGRGKYLLDTSTWMAVSRDGHNWIHANPKEAYAKGYMLPR